MFPRLDNEGRLWVPLMPSIVDGVCCDGMVELKPGEPDYEKQHAVAIRIRGQYADVDAEWPWSRSAS
jgi:hypothetical protein